ncbi:MAG: MrpF/PhaF family protein, partial [Micrococcus sp.]|nr:MrpF/PhaF family protein [Micrococcus sp.]
LVVLSAALILEMAVNRHTNNIVLVLLAAMVGFVGSVTIARFVEDNRPDMQPPTEGGSRTAAGSHTEEAARG